MSDLPEPLVPAGTDITGLDGFMLDTERLMASELWALSTGEEFKAAFGLWCRAWKQDPPGSLPNDERVLAAFSGAGARWPKVKAMALRGFVACSDGRLYHQVLCADVLRAARKKAERRERTRAATAARQRERNEERHDARNVDRHEQRNVGRDVHVTRSHRQDRDGTGTGRDRDGTEERGIPPPAQSAEPLRDLAPAVITIPVVGNDDGYGVTEADIADWEAAFPAVDVLQSLRHIRQWNLGKPARRKTLRGVRAHIIAWLTREQDRGGTQPLPARRGGTLEHNQAVLERFVAAGGEHGTG